MPVRINPNKRGGVAARATKPQWEAGRARQAGAGAVTVMAGAAAKCGAAMQRFCHE
ncbi:hypothetical protein BPNSA17_32950 [Bordetella petrii]